MSHDGLIHPAKDCAEQIAALGARIARLTHPAIYTGTHYANADVPAICPDCDSRDFISHGVTSVICRNCWLTAELDKAEAQVQTLKAQLAAYNTNGFADSDAMASAYLDMRVRAETAEAQNRQLREALERITVELEYVHEVSADDRAFDKSKRELFASSEGVNAIKQARAALAAPEPKA